MVGGQPKAELGVGWGVTRRILQAENAERVAGRCELLGSWGEEAGPDQHLDLALLGLEVEFTADLCLKG